MIPVALLFKFCTYFNLSCNIKTLWSDHFVKMLIMKDDYVVVEEPCI